MLRANSYMFWHKGAILREFNNNKGSEVQHVIPVLIVLTCIIQIKN
jgi:hypothetical protein